MRRLVAKLAHGSIASRREAPSSEPEGATRDELSTIIANHGDIRPSTGRLGLFRLDRPIQHDQPGEDRFDIDIVAIHGLNGDAEETWKHENGTFWLRDLLPAALPGARIFSYGYPSKVFFNRSVAGIRDFAIQLLQWLADERHSSMTDAHPIIFVCHSLGGIVFKEAMVIAVDRFRDIWLRSKGVIFMGTPHRGSESANLAKTMGNIANLALQASGMFRFSRGVQTQLLLDLQQNSRELIRIADDFAQRSTALQITSFYETDITPPMKDVIVGKSSAVMGIPNEQQRPLWANHRDLCRFSGQLDTNYQQIVQALKRTAASILADLGQQVTSLSTEQSYDEFEKACVATLNTTNTGSYESELGRQAEGTLHWLQNKPEFIDWTESKGSRLLWVTGHSGCGKTTMALYVARNLAQHQGHRDVVCRYFCDESKPSHDVNSLLRTLIYQIATCRRKLLRIVRRASDRGGMQIFRQFDALWDVFAQIACNERVAAITIIIDGIEGYDRKTQALLLHRISELLKSEGARQVKFFITSRPNARAFHFIDIRPAQIMLLRLEDEQAMIGADVNLFIHQRLEAMERRGICKPSTRNELEAILISKAGRTFLWVSLVLRLLEERSLLRTTDVVAIATQLPPDLALIYERLLYMISADDHELVGRLLRLIVVSARLLSGDELNILMAVSADLRSAASLRDDMLPMDSDMIIAVLGPLIRVCDSKISLVHSSLHDYLVNLSKHPSHPLSAKFGVDMQRDTRTLVAACVHYLSLEEFKEDLFRQELGDEDFSSFDSSEQPPADDLSASDFDLSNNAMFRGEENHDVDISVRIARQYKLFDYAAINWATDLLRCGETASQMGLEAFCTVRGCNEVRLTNWLRYFMISKGLTEPRIPADPLVVACYFGHTYILQAYLCNPSHHHDGLLWTCLFWSAREGHTPCVEAVLRHDAVLPTPSISPLHAAAQYGHLQPVLALMYDHRVDVNSHDSGGCTALSLAAANGHSDVVAALLSHESIDVNQPDKNTYTAVLWAALAKSERVVSHFLSDPRVDLDHMDRNGRTPLSWVAEEGEVGVIRALIQSRRVITNRRDMKGRTAISYAAQYGHLEVVRILLEPQPDEASIPDSTGRNAHSWAASQSDSDVLHELLVSNPGGADVEDRDGWTPLLWAMNPPGYQENITELLQSGTVDINRNDKVHGRTPLSWAASYGFLTIARTLTNTRGIIPDSRDSSGRTPLSHAASSGNSEVVTLLLSLDTVNINSQDCDGCTALSWAAREGCCEVTLLLLSNPKIDSTSRDKLGRSAYEVAVEHGHDRVANIIHSDRIETN